MYSLALAPGGRGRGRSGRRSPSASKGTPERRGAAQQRRGAVALLAALVPEAVEHAPARGRGRSASPHATGPRGWARPSVRPASTSSAEPTPSPMANAASFTSWQTIRPSTSPGASSTHSVGKPSRAKNSSAAVAANVLGAGQPGELDELRAVTAAAGGSRTAPGSPRAARLLAAHRTPTGAPPGGRLAPRAHPRVDDQLGRSRPRGARSRPARARSRSPSASGPSPTIVSERAVAAAGLERLRVVRPVRAVLGVLVVAAAASCARAGRRPPSAPGSGSAASAARRTTARSNDFATSKPTSIPTRSISSNGPIRKPPPRRQMRSICSWVATRSWSRRSASPPNGRPQRFTRKPGPSAARITVLPIASPDCARHAPPRARRSGRRGSPRAAPSAAAG